jgi:transposase
MITRKRAAGDLTGPFSARMSVGGFGLERDGKLGVQLDGSTGGGVSRLEVIEGPTGRRRRTKAERARIAAESLVPGVRSRTSRDGTGRRAGRSTTGGRSCGRVSLSCPRAWRHCRCLRNWWSRTPQAEAPAASRSAPGLEIVVGDVVIRASAGVR